MPHTSRQLIVNADDFGMSAEVNRGVETAVLEGIVTSASLMVHREAVGDAVRFAASRPELSLGLHLDLGEWAPVGDEWAPVREVVALDDTEAVEREVWSQLEAFHALVGRGPTHIDSHQHVHMASPVGEVVQREAARLDVPVRGLTPGVRHSGDFYGQTGRGDPMPELIEVDALLGLLTRLPEGLTELGCHPGGPDVVDPIYAAERWTEVRTLTDPRVRAALDAERIQLRSFHDLAPREGRLPAAVEEVA